MYCHYISPEDEVGGLILRELMLQEGYVPREDEDVCQDDHRTE